MRNNNPLNIEFSLNNSWRGARRPRTDDRFEEFLNIKWGLRAAFLILKKYIQLPPLGYGCDNLEKIIYRWAPPTENDSYYYLKFVSDYTKIPAQQPVRFSDKNVLCRIVQAMCIRESKETIDLGRIEDAYELARNA